ncbi:MAG: diguanylate cyclase [Lachnospiraceae bacterium]|nr:diguanylate cyclase [Lachnospiraceae bacterium]
MKKVFSKYFLGVVVVAMCVIAAFSHYILSRNIQHSMIKRAESRMEQFYMTIQKNEGELQYLKESLADDYLVRCRSFAMLIEESPDVLEDQERLEEIRKQLDVDELHVTDEKGIIRYGTVEKYIGLDFSTTEQTREFLAILEQPETEIVQEIQPNGSEGKEFQYVGVARRDKPGIVQVGIAPIRFTKAQERNNIVNVLEGVPLSQGEIVFAVDAGTGMIISHSLEKYLDTAVSEMGFQEDYLSKYENGAFVKIDGVKYFCVMQAFGDTVIGIAQTKDDMYAERFPENIFIMCYLVAVFLTMYFAVNRFLNRRVISGIENLLQDMEEISNGNLNKVVAVSGTPELCSLSDRINSMVQNLINHSGRLARVIDMVDAPIAAFEIFHEVQKVTVSHRFGSILGLTEKRLWELEQDSKAFGRFLTEAMVKPEEDHPNVYEIMLPDETKRWIRMITFRDSNSIMGMVMDVTDNIAAEKAIIKERDRDALTGLYNRASFEKQVRVILEEMPEGEAVMLMMDLDRFKAVNDTYGHAFGDTYLKETAARLLEFADNNDIVGRRSGDEFYLFLYGIKSRDKVTYLLDRFYRNLEKQPITLPTGEERMIGISIGAAWVKTDSKDFDDLLERADQMLYEGKRQGRNQYMLEPAG